ncbi:DNA replication initiation factor cdc45 [Malassezia nana]|uniref:DNA replication initiation factor cdc45 n=1 Tax=Malassezia nana TaxID=180528 RepID=A0AAF0EHU9_9BASI|nr:DNA replication initiation factor cdc45 [Malassezia nana]
MIVYRPRETGDDAPIPGRGRSDYAQAYKRICQSARQQVLGDNSSDTPVAPGGATVLILVTPDVDSLAATRIFTQLLANDEIPFRVSPVNGYHALQQVLAQDVYDHIELHTLVFINLGSLLSLPTTIPLPPHCSLHVIDSHRPWNLDNLFATSQINDRIFIWDDGEIEERLQREKEAYEHLEFDFESDSDSDASDTDDDEGDQNSVAASDTSEVGVSDPAANQRKRVQTSGEERESKRVRLDGQQRQLYRAVLAKYYARGSWTGMSAAQMMYILAVALGRGDRDNLWYAILGLTSQYLSNCIHASTYDGYAAALASDVVAMDTMERGEDEQISKKDKHGADDSSVYVMNHELRFTLYRHWSLESSMYHTSYVAAKLGIWREKGINKLRGLLAKMGLSLANCRQTYEHMELDLRQSLVRRMESIAPEYGLVDLTFRSFTRSYGFRTAPLSASDVVQGLSALLQAAHGVRIEIEGVQMICSEAGINGHRSLDRPVGTHGTRSLWSLAGDGMVVGKRPPPASNTDTEDTADDEENSVSATWVRNFFEAYTAMDVQKPKSVALLQQSLQLAKALHEAIVAQGVSIIIKQSIKTLRSFRLAVLQDGPSLHLFVHPDTLTRLGYWLIDALRDIVGEQHIRRVEAKRARRRSKGDDDADLVTAPQNLPFVLAALDTQRDVFVVVGIVGAPDYGDVSKNRFGLAFQDAAQVSGARMRNDRFESSVLEVRRDDLMPFIECLHLKA